ncbi:hypothetical protein PRUPE_1G218000 [Prunus persica]|uniref:Uncharacterized protein n=1 Tax=Prunus persica TaxID=3760 RepID=M5XZY1_PRUPE|nr:hypothetical protein PRUPE_1G218000 [Prunus persica]
MGRRKGVVNFDESPPDDFDPANPYMYPKWIDIVNHLQKCRHLVHQYLESTRGIGWGKDHRPLEFHGPKVEALSICE